MGILLEERKWLQFRLFGVWVSFVSYRFYYVYSCYKFVDLGDDHFYSWKFGNFLKSILESLPSRSRHRNKRIYVFKLRSRLTCLGYVLKSRLRTLLPSYCANDMFLVCPHFYLLLSGVDTFAGLGGLAYLIGSSYFLPSVGEFLFWWELSKCCRRMILLFLWVFARVYQIPTTSWHLKRPVGLSLAAFSSLYQDSLLCTATTAPSIMPTEGFVFLVNIWTYCFVSQIIKGIHS